MGGEKLSEDEIWQGILAVAKTKPGSTVFKASEVRDHLGLPKKQGRNEPIRRFCRENRELLRKSGLLLLEERDPKKQKPLWFILKK